MLQAQTIDGWIPSGFEQYIFGGLEIPFFICAGYDDSG